MFFRKKVGIDLGTANTVVYVSGEGVVLNEPTVVAYSTDDKRVLAVGEDARRMLGRTPRNIKAARPMKEGVIADFTTISAMITYYLKKALKGRVWWPEIMISIPGGSSQVERRAVVAAAKHAGASDVYLIEEPLAAAIGAKIPIAQPSGHMIVNIGGGTAEIGILSLGQLVVFKTVRSAGTKLDESILLHMKKKFNLHIGEQTAEEIKMKIGNAHIRDEDVTIKTDRLSMEVKGRDVQSGLPKILEISDYDIHESLQKPLKLIIEGIKEVLSSSPPELSADIVEKGIVLSGGSSLLKNLDKHVTFYTGVPSFVVEEPLFCVIRGIGVAIDNMEHYKKAMR